MIFHFTNFTLDSLLVFALWAFLGTYALWLFYLAVMNLQRAKEGGTISRAALWLGYPLLAIGLLIDLVVNVLVFTVVFLDMPRELTVTARLARLIHQQPSRWRGRAALWFCKEFLDTFDPSGRHCR